MIVFLAGFISILAGASLIWVSNHADNEDSFFAAVCIVSVITFAIMVALGWWFGITIWVNILIAVITTAMSWLVAEFLE